MGDVVTAPGLVVAVGGSGGIGSARAWRSVDGGVTWIAEPLPRSTPAVTTLVPWGERLLAVGTGTADCPHPEAVEVALRSAAGDWTAAPFDQLFCGGGTAYAAGSGTHAVIVGASAGDVPFAWSATDGLHWIDHSSGFGDRIPAGVGTDMSGFIVIGTDPAGPSPWEARSVDGATWTAPRAMTGVSGATIIGGPLNIDGSVAVFLGGSGGAVGIARTDGSGQWHSELCKGLDAATVSRIVSAGDGLVALGGDEHGPKAWVSSNGVSWRALALPGEAIASGSDAVVTGVAASDGRAYLSGQILDPTGANGIGALWSGPATLLEP
jgi:hypothetical protein